mmetsp:Transcript_686/g.1819  ORF Transcript_686/g.1819 Transcript_686/m.1819 type:complete len:263 (+) Transcript_686:1664-2452(+)
MQCKHRPSTAQLVAVSGPCAATQPLLGSLACGVLGRQASHNASGHVIAGGVRGGAGAGAMHQVVHHSTRAKAGRHVVQAQLVPQAPGHDVVGARGVAADAQPAQQRAGLVVQGQAATKHVDAAHALAGQRVLGASTPAGGGSLVCGHCIHGVGLLQAEQRATRLGQAVQVGSGDGEAGQGERVAGVGLLRRDDARAGPLLAEALATVNDHLDQASAVHDGCPHLERESSILCIQHLVQCVPQLRISGKLSPHNSKQEKHSST